MRKHKVFSICNDMEDGVIAIREKSSVEIDKSSGEVKMHDFIYTFDEIIAVGERLTEIAGKELVDVS